MKMFKIVVISGLYLIFYMHKPAIMQQQIYTITFGQILSTEPPPPPPPRIYIVAIFCGLTFVYNYHMPCHLLLPAFSCPSFT